MNRSTAAEAPRTVRVDVLARVEGEGGLTVRVRHGAVREVALRIYEPPRLFEAFLRGRSWDEVPDITARICGICPVAYQTSAANALERAFGIALAPELGTLRRLLYCGEWIESHALHAVMLHAPDFLGYESGIHMARDHGDMVGRGLRLKKCGNDLVRVLGGREIHPVSLKVGGFHRVPSKRELAPIRARLPGALEDAVAILDWALGFRYPDLERDYEFVALRHPDRYAIEDGRIATTRGDDLDPSEFETCFAEDHVERSNALHGRFADGAPYHVGPLARWALSSEQLDGQAREAARRAALPPVLRNPFRSLPVRLVETVYALEEAMRIIDAWTPPAEPSAPVTPRAGTGHGVSEAPRGMLYHRYRTTAEGLVADARIVPPTAQNLRTIEDDVRRWVETHLADDDATLRWGCEHAIRNYDPCISCATHFLRLDRVVEP